MEFVKFVSIGSLLSTVNVDSWTRGPQRIIHQPDFRSMEGLLRDSDGNPIETFREIPRWRKATFWWLVGTLYQNYIFQWDWVRACRCNVYNFFWPKDLTTKNGVCSVTSHMMHAEDRTQVAMFAFFLCQTSIFSNFQGVTSKLRVH